MPGDPSAPDSGDDDASEKSGDLRERMLDLADQLEAEAEALREDLSGFDGFDGDDFAASEKVDIADRIRERVEQIATDGGLDAETVIGTVDPGDVVVVAGSPYRVVDVEADEDDGVLRLYDLVERTETVKAAGAGDVDIYLHRSESDAIQTRVQEEREQRDAGDEEVEA